MSTYAILKGTSPRLIRRLIGNANVCAREVRKGNADFYFVSPETITNLTARTKIAMIVIPKGHELSQFQKALIRKAVAARRVQLAFSIDEVSAVETLKAWFEPKTMCEEQK